MVGSPEDHAQRVAKPLIVLLLVLIALAGSILILLGSRIPPLLEREQYLAKSIQEKQSQLQSIEQQLNQALKSLNDLNQQIQQEGSPELKDAARQIVSWANVVIRASAVPTGQKSPNGDLYTIKLWLQSPPAVLNGIKEVEYHFDDPSYRPPRKFGYDPNTGFMIQYSGWGCLPDVKLTAVPRDQSDKMTSTHFNLCAALGW